MSLTITEALAEIKTIQKRITKKQEFISGFLFRQDLMRDPLENQGGAKVAIQAEVQAMRDLTDRIVKIRSAIQQTNSSTLVTIVGIERSINDWLVWRREVAPGQQAFNKKLTQQLQMIRQNAQQKGVAVRSVDQPASSQNDIVVNLDEKALAAGSELIEEVLGTLDGILSLKNATIVIDV